MTKRKATIGCQIANECGYAATKSSSMFYPTVYYEVVVVLGDKLYKIFDNFSKLCQYFNKP
jgi:hypothetical protein